MNNIGNILLSTDKTVIYNLHLNFFLQCIAIYKVRNVTNCVKKVEAEVKHLYALPLYTLMVAQLKIIILKQGNRNIHILTNAHITCTYSYNRSSISTLMIISKLIFCQY